MNQLKLLIVVSNIPLVGMTFIFKFNENTNISYPESCWRREPKHAKQFRSSRPTGVLKTQSNIYDGAFLKNLTILLTLPVPIPDEEKKIT